jgi:DNA-binding IclR family transcriptional regulator
MSRDGTGASGGVQSVAKALEVLQAFMGRERFLSLGELARIAGLDKSAVQRVTRTLKDHGYLDQDPATRRYALGTRALDLSYSFLRTHPLIERAIPVLVDLRRLVKERVDLVLPDGNTVVYVLRMQAKRETFKPALVGRRVPMFCTAAGRAILSRLPEGDARAVIEGSELRAYTPRTLTDPAVIMMEVERARRDGYAIQAEEWLPKEMVAAAAVMNADGCPVAAVNIAVSTMDWEAEAMGREMSAHLCAAAAELSG